MSVFAKDNLMAWCIVPFDANKRGPKQRARMLQRLGIESLAYDWRQAHIDSFDEELRQLTDHGIKLSAFWLAGGYPKDEKSAVDDPMLRPVIEFIQRHKLNIEVWKTCSVDGQDEMADDEARYQAGTRQIGTLCNVFNDLGCRYGLYNHGGWGGEPETMAEIARRLQSKDIGIVYNFHHGHEHLERMPGAFAAMRPYLTCVNLNGTTPGGPKILPLAAGERDAEILSMIADSGYNGPLGILDHRMETDAEESLRQNLVGLQVLLKERGDEEALKTYA